MKYCLFCMRPLEEGSAHCPHCGKQQSYNAPEYHLLPGTIVGGKFMIGAALGEGGFGITYVGVDVNLEIRVAVKEYFPNGYANRSSAASASVSIISSQERQEIYDKGKIRFLDEARTLAKFTDEQGVVGVRDFFESNNTAYIVMEFLDGITLKDYVKRNGLLRPEQAVEMLAPVMESLQRVHKANLIHRDISPDNIMVLSNNRVKLLDFGAARSVSAEANKSLSVVLKPGYAPEEQYRSKGNQGSWTDVYAMSATVYKVITGVTPDDSTQRMYQDELRAPSSMGIAISPPVERALLKGLAVLQRNRYQDMEQLLNGLRGRDPELMNDSPKTFTPATMAVGGGRGVYIPPQTPPRNPGKNNGFTPPNGFSGVRTGQPGVRTGQPAVRTGQPAVRTGQPPVAPVGGYRPMGPVGAFVAPVKKKSNALMIILYILSLLVSLAVTAAFVLKGVSEDMVITASIAAAVVLILFVVSAVRGVKKRGVKKSIVSVLCLVLAVIIAATSIIVVYVTPELRYAGKWEASVWNDYYDENGYYTTDQIWYYLTVYVNGTFSLSMYKTGSSSDYETLSGHYYVTGDELKLWWTYENSDDIGEITLTSDGRRIYFVNKDAGELAVEGLSYEEVSFYRNDVLGESW